MQVTLTSSEITCEHCIATIRGVVDAIEGARFLGGNHESRQFAIEVPSGALLDAVGAALEAEGYPIGDANASGEPQSTRAPALLDLAAWRPSYRVTRTEAGADVNYACPCSCEAGFALDRSRTEQAPESCCCGRRILVGADAEARLRVHLDSLEAYAFDIQTLEMPWGQPLAVALAIPREGAEHGAHEPHS